MRILLGLCSILLTISVAAAELRQYQTRHYRIHTDVDPELARDLSRRMDLMHDEYARRLVEFAPKDGGRILDVYIFARRDDYRKFNGIPSDQSSGVFKPGVAVATFLEEQGRDEMRQTLQHEAFHQFAYTFIGPGLPIWLNEGLAQVFEEAVFDGRNFSLGEVPPHRVQQLRTDLDQRRLFDFRSLMTLTPQQWLENARADKERGDRQYNQAWAMTHFLIFSTDERGQPRFRTRLIDMLRIVHKGKHGHDAFVDAFSDNLAGFEQMFYQYARQLQPTPKATCIEYQELLSRLLILLQEQDQQFKDIGEFRSFIQLACEKGILPLERDRDPRALFRDLEGSVLTSEQLRFEPRPRAPLPDLVSHRVSGFQLRSRFTQVGRSIEHEILIERSGR